MHDIDKEPVYHKSRFKSTYDMLHILLDRLGLSPDGPVTAPLLQTLTLQLL